MPKSNIVPPEILPIAEVLLPEAKLHVLDNGMSVWEIHAPAQNVLRVEFVVRAGRPNEKQRAVSATTERLLMEGAGGKSAAELAELLDYYGASVYNKSQLDVSGLILNTLPVYAEQLIPIMADMVWRPHFDRTELQLYIAQSKQRLSVDLSKIDTLAYRRLTERIFGGDHWYGYNTLPDDYDALTVDVLKEHHARLYHPANAFMIISGHTTQAHIDLLNTFFGSIQKGEKAPASIKEPAYLLTSKTSEHIKVKGSMQVSLWMGRGNIDRKGPDYAKIHVLNTILGGYFGSRLMANIREKKGYTYHISSALDTMWQGGMWYLCAEVNKRLHAKVVAAVWDEVAHLRSELVPEEELEMVRSYLMGSFLSMVDGPFAIHDTYRTLLIEEMPLSHFSDLVETVKSISSEDLRMMANIYLQKSDFIEVSAG